MRRRRGAHTDADRDYNAGNLDRNAIQHAPHNRHTHLDSHSGAVLNRAANDHKAA